MLRQAGMPRRDVLQRLRITDGALSKLNTGKSHRPSPDTVQRLLSLGIDPAWVETGKGAPQLPPEAVRFAEQSAPYVAESERQGPGWQTNLTDVEARLILGFRALPRDVQGDILHTVERLRLPAIARKAGSSTLPPSRRGTVDAPQGLLTPRP